MVEKAAQAVTAQMTSEASPSATPRPVSAKPNPEQWVDLHGDYLFHYALARLRSRTRAEDLVQETFLAALRGQDRFAGRAAERTWLTGILRNKIFDYFRTVHRETSFTDLQICDGEDPDDSFVSGGLRNGAWTRESAPVEWSPKAGESLDQQEFWKQFHACTDKLPLTICRAFLLREIDQLSTDAICQLMHITENHLGVLLHRGRLVLRRCLEKNWFGR